MAVSELEHVSWILRDRDPLLRRSRAARESAETSRYGIEDAKMAASSNDCTANSSRTCPASLRLKKAQAHPTGRPAGLAWSIRFVFSRLLWEKILARVGRACPGASSTAGPPHTSSSAGRCDLDFMFFRIRSAACSKLRAGQNKLGSHKEIALHCSRTANDRTDCVTLRNAYDDIQQTCLSATPLF